MQNKEIGLILLLALLVITMVSNSVPVTLNQIFDGNIIGTQGQIPVIGPDGNYLEVWQGFDFNSDSNTLSAGCVMLGDGNTYCSSNDFPNPDLSGLIPYSGATSDVNLGSKNILAKKIGLNKSTNPTPYFELINSTSFSFVQSRLNAGTWTDLTTIARTTGTNSGDVLDGIGDTLVIGNTTKFEQLYIDVATTRSATGTYVWEYSLGSNVWATIPGIVDGTNNILNDGVITFSAPVNWSTDSQNGSAQTYFIRLRLTASPPATEPTISLIIMADGLHPLEVYSAPGNGATPDFMVTRNGQVRMGLANTSINSEKLYVAGNGTFTGVLTSTGVTVAGIANITRTTGYTLNSGVSLLPQTSTATTVVENSPTLSVSSSGWNNFTSKLNMFSIGAKSIPEAITSSRLAFNNATVDGFTGLNTETMNLTQDGQLNVLGKPNIKVFDASFGQVSGTFVNRTSAIQTLGVVTGDVLNAVGDYFYVGSRNKFESVYFDFETIMSSGTTRTWEYWNGTAWTAMSLTSDGTSNWANDGTITFNAPADWTRNSVGTTTARVGPIYWFRVGTVSGTFTVEPTLRICTIEQPKDIFSNNQFDAGTNWTSSGDFGYSSNGFVWSNSTGTGSIKQLASNFVNPVKPNTWYRFRYWITVLGSANTLVWIGEDFADKNTFIQTTSLTEIDVFFKTNSNPSDFVLYGSGVGTLGLRFDGVELLELVEGNVLSTGGIKASDYYSSDGNIGFTGTCTYDMNFVVKNGLIISCS